MVFPVDPDDFEEWCERRGGDFFEAEENNINPDGEELVCSAPGGGQVTISSNGSVVGYGAYDYLGNQLGEEGEPTMHAYWWKDGKIDHLGGSDWAQDELVKHGSQIRNGKVEHREEENHRGEHRVYEDHLKFYGRNDRNIGFVITGEDESFHMED